MLGKAKDISIGVFYHAKAAEINPRTHGTRALRHIVSLQDKFPGVLPFLLSQRKSFLKPFQHEAAGYVAFALLAAFVGQADLAVRDADKAISLSFNPSLPYTIKSLALLHASQRRGADAVSLKRESEAWLKKAEEGIPDAPVLALAWALQHCHPMDPDPNAAYAWYLKAKDLEQKAREEYGETVSRDSEVDMLVKISPDLDLLREDPRVKVILGELEE